MIEVDDMNLHDFLNNSGGGHPAMGGNVGKRVMTATTTEGGKRGGKMPSAQYSVAPKNPHDV